MAGLQTAGALAGVAMVTWSNIYALKEYGVLGVILGASTPVFLIIAESILSYEIIQRRKLTTTETVEDEATQGATEQVKPIVQPVTTMTDTVTDKTVDNVADRVPEMVEEKTVDSVPKSSVSQKQPRQPNNQN